MAARLFLYVIAGIIFLLVGVAVLWNVFQDQIIEYALVPNEPVEILDAVQESEYADPRMWLARPDKQTSPISWLPEGFGEVDALEAMDAEEESFGDAPAEPEEPAQFAPVAAEYPRLPVFYVLPTTYLKRDRWNAPIYDPQARFRQQRFAASQASAFTGVGDIWAPYYRQAVLGAFLTTESNSDVALRFAYRDVETAFDYFLREIGEDQPFLLVGHSQGSLHLLTLLNERMANNPALADRVVAAYLIGWPISAEADLPAVPLPACETAEQTHCIFSFVSFAEPADPRQVQRIYEDSVGLSGLPRRDTDMLCVNPLTGTIGGEAGAEANLGALMPNEEIDDATLEPGLIPARCGERGLLLIGAPPNGYERYVLPGNNYHVFDYMLFWANLRADVGRRVATWFEGRG
ncbi:MAG: DUF3089 domain-containing protein [Sphingomonadaceae bacterium]|nr:DUF3089 domain-containing protein [Sphingomonadaceae bacterium]